MQKGRDEGQTGPCRPGEGGGLLTSRGERRGCGQLQRGHSAEDQALVSSAKCPAGRGLLVCRESQNHPSSIFPRVVGIPGSYTMGPCGAGIKSMLQWTADTGRGLTLQGGRMRALVSPSAHQAPANEPPSPIKPQQEAH